MDEVGVELEHPVPFPAGQPCDPELKLLEVPESPVDELRGAGGGAPGDVPLLDEQHVEPPLSGVEGDPGARDPRADHHEVEPPRKRGQRPLAPVWEETAHRTSVGRV